MKSFSQASVAHALKHDKNLEIHEVKMIVSRGGNAQDNVSGTQETNAVITTVAESFRDVEESAGQLRSTADLLAQNIGKFGKEE